MLFGLLVYMCIPLCIMKKEKIHDDGLYIKLPGALKAAATKYAEDKKTPGGLSGLIREFLEKKTKNILAKAS